MDEEDYTLPEFVLRTFGGIGLTTGILACLCKLVNVHDPYGVVELHLSTWMLILIPCFFLFFGMEERKNNREYRKKEAAKAAEAATPEPAAE